MSAYERILEEQRDAKKTAKDKAAAAKIRRKSVQSWRAYRAASRRRAAYQRTEEAQIIAQRWMEMKAHAKT